MAGTLEGGAFRVNHDVSPSAHVGGSPGRREPGRAGERPTINESSHQPPTVLAYWWNFLMS
jgi:hypothetical protein